MKTPLMIQCKPILKSLLVALLLIVISVHSFGQSTTVYTLQNMNFGAFSQGNNGGTVEISTAGVRTATGSVVPLNFGIQYGQAIFEIEAPAGTIISIVNGPDATLTGSNGGTMSLHLGNSDPASPFNTTVTPPARTRVNIGATLTVGNATVSPPGAYTGTIDISFNYQ